MTLPASLVSWDVATCCAFATVRSAAAHAASSDSEGPACVVPVGAGVVVVGSGTPGGVRDSVGDSVGNVVAGVVGEVGDELVPLGSGESLDVAFAVEPVGWGVPVSEKEAGCALPRPDPPDRPWVVPVLPVLPVPVLPSTGAQAVCWVAIAASTWRCA